MIEQNEEKRLWWESFHVEAMADLYLDRKDDDELQKTIEFLTKHLELKPGHTVFDQCCGTGSLTLALADAGYPGIGVDLCPIYIDRANEKWSNTDELQNRIQAEFYCEDAFTFRTSKRCQAAFNWFSSFGYAEDDLQNVEMIRRMNDSLEIGSLILLDVPNFYFIVRNFQTFLVREGVSQDKKVILYRKSELDLKCGRLNQIWNWKIGDQEVDRRQSSLKIYFPDQIAALLEESGFQVVDMFGSLTEESIQLDSPRLIVKARKVS